MSSKNKKSSTLCHVITIFCFGISFIFVISNVVYLIDTSTSCPPTEYDEPAQSANEETSFINNVIKPLPKPDFPNQVSISEKSSLNIAIATVVCHKPNDPSPPEKALVLLKSTVISAILYQTFPINIEFYLLLEHERDKEYFIKNIEPFTESIPDIQVNVYFYSVFEIVPEKYFDTVFGSGLRCSFARIFLANALLEVDSILYLDTDVIITGNLAEIWNIFYKMDDIQLVGAVMDIEPENKPWYKVYMATFENIPVATPRGINAGVLFMNLSKMREYEFSEKLMKLHEQYSISMNDQSLLNTLLFYNPYLLYLLPCQYNFRPPACTLGFYCSDVLGDSTGIQILHQYKNSNRYNIENAFKDIAEAYQKITEPNLDLITNLLVKLRDMYKGDFKSAYNHGKCDGVLNHLLFRNIIL